MAPRSEKLLEHRRCEELRRLPACLMRRLAAAESGKKATKKKHISDARRSNQLL